MEALVSSYWNSINFNFPLIAQRVSKRAVLVVEDDLALQTVITRIIKSVDKGIDVKWATTLGEAYQLTRNGATPSLILSDIFLPNFQSGTTLYDYYQQEHPKVPFIFMSSLSSDRYLKLFSESQMSPPFIAKPFSVVECRDLLEGFLLGNRSQIM